MQLRTPAIYAKGAMARAPLSTLGLVLMLPLIVVQAADTLPGNIPTQLQPAVDARAFKASFEVGTWLNPFYLRGDFDGDGLADYALLVTRRNDGKKGIAVWLSTKHQSGPTIIGAGRNHESALVIPMIGISSTHGRYMTKESSIRGQQ